QRFQNGAGDSTQNEYEFPGQSSFATHALNDTVSLPASSPGTILIRVQNSPDGSLRSGQGAIVYDRPATGATFTYVDSSFEAFTLHQTGTVPAGGSTRFRFAYAQDYLAANAASLAQTASTAFLNTLNVTTAGTGSGTVTSSPGGINCGSTCSAGYGYGTAVTLTATPAVGSTFIGWSGACSGTSTCTVTPSDTASVTATFDLTPETLSISKKGNGKGTVTSYPDAISCGKACTHSFDYGTSVILRAKPSKGSSFGGWSGACKGKSACALLMTTGKTVRATFLKNCVVPKLKGKTLKIARRLLKSHNCGLGKVTHRFSRTVKRGHVISTKPKAGRHLRHGAKVRLVLSR
ncbi:MAG TPA: PASTA domain-containing protein, partial [Gaiellaceae bacterium]|nr:PASTA domain-containing protein [Gaiellaceae bacterium]